MGSDERRIDADLRNEETPLAVILGGRVIDEALRGIRFHPPASDYQFRDSRGGKRVDREQILFPF